MRCDDVMSHHRDDEKARGRGRKQWGWLEQREKYRSRKPQAVLEGTRAAGRQQQEQGGSFRWVERIASAIIVIQESGWVQL